MPAAGHRAIDGVENTLDADGGMGQIDQEHAGAIGRFRHDDTDARPGDAGDEGFSAVDDPFIAIPHGRGEHHGRIRSGAAVFRGLGHEKR